jgi:hypothetical protein
LGFEGINRYYVTDLALAGATFWAKGELTWINVIAED